MGAKAYLPDVAAPIKHCFRVGDKTFSEVEENILYLVGEKYGLPKGIPASIKLADVQCLEYERHQLMGVEPAPWDTGDTRPLHCWDWKTAERNFLDRFAEL